MRHHYINNQNSQYLTLNICVISYDSYFIFLEMFNFI